jgi:RNA recognition motif-containing protein
VNVHLPKDRVTQTHQSYGFVEFLTEEDADYAIKIMNQVRLYGKPIRVNKVQFLSRITQHCKRSNLIIITGHF